MTKNKSCFNVLSFILVFVLFTTIFSVIAYADYPKLNARVNDFAGYLSQDEINSLELKVASVEKTTSTQIVIVTVENTNGEDRVLYASHLGDFNGVGKSDLDNGIVILWSQDNEAGGAIATGRGIGGIITDADIARIGRECKSDLYETRYYQGFDCILNGISNRVQNYLIMGEAGEDASKKDASANYFSQRWKTTLILIIIFSIIIIIILGTVNPSNGVFRSSAYVGRTFNSFGGFKGGGGFGGSGGFGGGSFGGGGGRF